MNSGELFTISYLGTRQLNLTESLKLNKNGKSKYQTLISETLFPMGAGAKGRLSILSCHHMGAGDSTQAARQASPLPISLLASP